MKLTTAPMLVCRRKRSSDELRQETLFSWRGISADLRRAVCTHLTESASFLYRLQEGADLQREEIRAPSDGTGPSRRDRIQQWRPSDKSSSSSSSSSRQGCDLRFGMMLRIRAPPMKPGISVSFALQKLVLPGAIEHTSAPSSQTRCAFCAYIEDPPLTHQPIFSKHLSIRHRNARPLSGSFWTRASEQTKRHWLGNVEAAHDARCTRAMSDKATSPALRRHFCPTQRYINGCMDAPGASMVPVAEAPRTRPLLA